jgi:hypothetical protein
MMKDIGLASYIRRSLPGLLGCGVARVHEHAAAGQDAVHVGHHRGDPAHVVVLAQRAFLAGQQLVHVALHRGFPVALVGHVDGEFGGAFGTVMSSWVSTKLPSRGPG